MRALLQATASKAADDDVQLVAEHKVSMPRELLSVCLAAASTTMHHAVQVWIATSSSSERCVTVGLICCTAGTGCWRAAGPRPAG